MASCYSGAFVEVLAALPNVHIVVTATDADTQAKADQDFFEEDHLFFNFDVADPNPDDEGTEFMSGFVEDLRLLMADPEAVASMTDVGVESGIGLVPVLYHCAFESAVAKDWTALNGETHPQRSLELTRTIVVPGYQGTMTMQVPYRCPRPAGFLPESD